jgi:protein-tyrosine phosphatase
LFFFSKNKPVLKDLIPDNHIDIHSHLLPGIDDGARTFEDTLHLVQSLQGFGISEFVTTPHIIQHVWNNTREAILFKATTTVATLQAKNITVPFRAAAEYLMDDSFERLFKSNNLLTLKDNYVLVEMSYINPPMQLYSILFDLQVAGYIPVLAHPERYLFYQNNFNEFVKLKNAGCLFQLNLLSVVGYYGDAVGKVAAQLLKKGMYNFVGSDVHHTRHIAAFEQKVTLKDLVPLHEVIANNQFFKL